MTSSIHDSQDLLESAPGPDAKKRPAKSTLVRGVQIFTGFCALAGVAFMATAFSHNEWRLGVIGFTLISASCAGAVVWAVDSLLASRNEFYNRGKVAGFWEGLHGVPPTSDDPLLRH